eukprot:CAMPEP_0114973106 /NCGR_PEP_ID=MMETSP0216-20121206/772_1 /TAXON_ID=223996 /ORGANISM="Protocruzia adherens, Strain Boccale" /LENGTH=1429 /DNA_ID=CAMNT_0002333565 /DNA_START=146 /DNA_END=4435 /DNA_ORIENTATION=+
MYARLQETINDKADGGGDLFLDIVNYKQKRNELKGTLKTRQSRLSSFYKDFCHTLTEPSTSASTARDQQSIGSIVTTPKGNSGSQNHPNHHHNQPYYIPNNRNSLLMMYGQGEKRQRVLTNSGSRDRDRAERSIRYGKNSFMSSARKSDENSDISSRSSMSDHQYSHEVPHYKKDAALLLGDRLKGILKDRFLDWRIFVDKKRTFDNRQSDFSSSSSGMQSRLDRIQHFMMLNGQAESANFDASLHRRLATTGNMSDLDDMENGSITDRKNSQENLGEKFARIKEEQLRLKNSLAISPKNDSFSLSSTTATTTAAPVATNPSAKNTSLRLPRHVEADINATETPSFKSITSVQTDHHDNNKKLLDLLKSNKENIMTNNNNDQNNNKNAILTRINTLRSQLNGQKPTTTGVTRVIPRLDLNKIKVLDKPDLTPGCTSERVLSSSRQGGPVRVPARGTSSVIPEVSRVEEVSHMAGRVDDGKSGAVVEYVEIVRESFDRRPGDDEETELEMFERDCEIAEEDGQCVGHEANKYLGPQNVVKVKRDQTTMINPLDLRSQEVTMQLDHSGFTEQIQNTFLSENPMILADLTRMDAADTGLNSKDISTIFGKFSPIRTKRTNDIDDDPTMVGGSPDNMRHSTRSKSAEASPNNWKEQRVVARHNRDNLSTSRSFHTSHMISRVNPLEVSDFQDSHNVSFNEKSPIPTARGNEDDGAATNRSQMRMSRISGLVDSIFYDRLHKNYRDMINIDDNDVDKSAVVMKEDHATKIFLFINRLYLNRMINSVRTLETYSRMRATHKLPVILEKVSLKTQERYSQVLRSHFERLKSKVCFMAIFEDYKEGMGIMDSLVNKRRMEPGFQKIVHKAMNCQKNRKSSKESRLSLHSESIVRIFDVDKSSFLQPSTGRQTHIRNLSQFQNVYPLLAKMVQLKNQNLLAPAFTKLRSAVKSREFQDLRTITLKEKIIMAYHSILRAHLRKWKGNQTSRLISTRTCEKVQRQFMKRCLEVRKAQDKKKVDLFFRRWALQNSWNHSPRFEVYQLKSLKRAARIFESKASLLKLKAISQLKYYALYLKLKQGQVAASPARSLVSSHISLTSSGAPRPSNHRYRQSFEEFEEEEAFNCNETQSTMCQDESTTTVTAATLTAPESTSEMALRRLNLIVSGKVKMASSDSMRILRKVVIDKNICEGKLSIISNIYNRQAKATKERYLNIWRASTTELTTLIELQLIYMKWLEKKLSLKAFSAWKKVKHAEKGAKNLSRVLSRIMTQRAAKQVFENLQPRETEDRILKIDTFDCAWRSESRRAMKDKNTPKNLKIFQFNTMLNSVLNGRKQEIMTDIRWRCDGDLEWVFDMVDFYNRKSLFQQFIVALQKSSPRRRKRPLKRKSGFFSQSKDFSKFLGITKLTEVLFRWKLERSMITWKEKCFEQFDSEDEFY